jgi:REP element-mobilizing transposase RayT
MMMKNPAVTLGKIIRFFKAKSALKIRNEVDISFYWQRNYHEHVIRDRYELSRIRKYIKDNPTNWPLDEDNPANRME